MREREANLNTLSGTRSHDDLLERTGKRVPVVEPTRMMKTEAIRRLVYVSAPPPCPQLTASDMGGKRYYVGGRLERGENGPGS